MKIEEIKEGQVFKIVAPRFISMMCGAYQAGFYPDGRVTLVYEDESRESAQFSLSEAQAILDRGLSDAGIFAVVSAVQHRARS